MPGIDTAYLAMDSEEGFEVVWNEAQFSTAKKFASQEEKLKGVFEALTLIDHPNIVRFHNYWIDKGNPSEKKAPRVRLPLDKPIAEKGLNYSTGLDFSL